MGKKTNPRPKMTGPSKGGRPRKDGDRYPSGQLKPAGPNKRAVEIRKALGLDKLNQRQVPLDVAHRNGWLSDVDYLTGIRFANLHHAAGFSRAGGSMGSCLEIDAATETSIAVTAEAKSFFSSLPDKEMAALWDSVFDRSERDPGRANEASAKAMREWKTACAAMTMQERGEVTDVCVLDSFPQWIIQRAAGRMDTTWERKRKLLVSGLAKVRQALRRPRPPTEMSSAQPRRPSGPQQIERTLYVDEEGNKVLEVERRSRSTHRLAI